MTWELVFWAVTLSVCAAPFLPALWEWRFRTDAGPLLVVRELDVNARHFAHTFFDQITALFEARGIDVRMPPPPFNGEFSPGEQFAFLGRDTRPRWSHAILDERRVPFVVISAGDLLLDGGLVYQREVYCSGKLYAGADTTFRAVYAGTDVVLGERCVVARWLHSQGHVHIGRDSQLYGRISSSSSLTVAEGTRFERLNARVIRTASDAPMAETEAREAPLTDWTPAIPLHRLDASTVRSPHTVHLPPHTRIVDSVISLAALTVGAGAWVQGALKARTTLLVEEHARVDGAVVAKGPVHIAEGATVEGPIISEVEVVVATNVRIGHPDRPTTITAPVIRIAGGAQCAGSIWASEHGVVLPARTTQARK